MRPTASGRAAASTTSRPGAPWPRSTAADWHEWPDELRHPESASVAEFADKHSADVDFHRWLQWQLDDQLTAAQATAVAAGMGLGIMHDLAVGVDPNGADAWALQDVLALGVTAGAPPDEFNQLGQDWSQPPWRPDELANAGVRTVPRAGQRSAAACGRRPHRPHHRAVPAVVDPEGLPADRGHLRALRPRSDDRDRRAGGAPRRRRRRRRGSRAPSNRGCATICASAACSARRSCGSRLDRDGDGGPLPAERWREYCLSSVTTHDLPPTAGYLAGEHVRLRDELGLLTRSAEEELAADRAPAGGLAGRTAPGRAVGRRSRRRPRWKVVSALYGYLGRTPSRLLALSLADAVGDCAPRISRAPPTNIRTGGCRWPVPDGKKVLLEDIFTDPRAAALAEVMRIAVNTQM